MRPRRLAAVPRPRAARCRSAARGHARAARAACRLGAAVLSPGWGALSSWRRLRPRRASHVHSRRPAVVHRPRAASCCSAAHAGTRVTRARLVGSVPPCSRQLLASWGPAPAVRARDDAQVAALLERLPPQRRSAFAALEPRSAEEAVARVARMPPAARGGLLEALPPTPYRPTLSPSPVTLRAARTSNRPSTSAGLVPRQRNASRAMYVRT